MANGRDSEGILVTLSADEIENITAMARSRGDSVDDLIAQIIETGVAEYFRNESPSKGPLH